MSKIHISSLDESDKEKMEVVEVYILMSSRMSPYIIYIYKYIYSIYFLSTCFSLLYVQQLKYGVALQ